MPISKSGPNFEELITRQLELHNLRKVSSKKISNFPKEIVQSLYPEGALFVGSNKYTSIYGNPNCRTEFVAYLPNKKTIRIECKWQQTPGTASEKIPYFYLNFVENKFPEDIIILIYGGGNKGFRMAIDWLKNAWNERLYIRKNFEKELKIFTLEEFIVWTNNFNFKEH